MTRVVLSEDHRELARDAGRRKFAQMRHVPHRWNRPDGARTVAVEVEAYGAELAVSVVTGVPWTFRVEPNPDGDLPGGIQVRHTRHRAGRLLFHEGDDDPEHTFFLVTGQFPEYDVRGFILGADALAVGVVRELQPGRPAVCVEQDELRPPAAWHVCPACRNRPVVRTLCGPCWLRLFGLVRAAPREARVCLALTRRLG